MTNSTHAARFLVVLSIVSVVPACDHDGSSSIPLASSPVLQTGSFPAAPIVLTGYVYDTAFRPVGSARVQVVDGPQAGTATTSNATGYFEFAETFSSLMTVRAEKDGYATGTEAARSAASNRAFAFFRLASPAPAVPVAGDYTLTISADSTCALPVDVQVRTYSATVIANSSAGPANTNFDGIVSGGLFAPHGNVFWIGVFGDYLAISTLGEGPSLVEQLGPNRYLAFYGEANVSVGTEGTSRISAPFKGSVTYCELISAGGPFDDCSTARATVNQECTSSNSRLTLTRR
jgi:hypothetical protein